jgi:hypothetical protein
MLTSPNHIGILHLMSGVVSGPHGPMSFSSGAAEVDVGTMMAVAVIADVATKAISVTQAAQLPQPAKA